MLEPLAIVAAVAAGLIGTRSILQSRARRQRSERRRQRRKREAGIWWASLWLGRVNRQKKLTYTRAQDGDVTGCDVALFVNRSSSTKDESLA